MDVYDLQKTSLSLTLDITSLYINISRENCLCMLKHYHSQPGEASTPSEFVIQMASYV